MSRIKDTEVEEGKIYRDSTSAARSGRKWDMGQRAKSGGAGFGLTLLGYGAAFVVPNMLVPVFWGYLMMAGGGLLLLWNGFALLREFLSPPDNFDDVKTWSVSAQLNGFQRVQSADGSPCGLLWVELINHSANQSRVLDITLTLESSDEAAPIHYATTEGPPRTAYQDEIKGMDVSQWLKDSFIPLPLTIPANSHVKGTIEMAATGDLSYSVVVIRLVERRSHLIRVLRPDECYDALRQRAYVGRLGHPPNVFKRRRARYKKIKRTKVDVVSGY